MEFSRHLWLSRESCVSNGFLCVVKLDGMVVQLSSRCKIDLHIRPAQSCSNRWLLKSEAGRYHLSRTRRYWCILFERDGRPMRDRRHLRRR